MKSLILDVLDRAILEPIVRYLHPLPAERGIGARVIHKGKGEMRLLCLSGAFCSNTAANWKSWINELRRAFPEAEITTVNGFYYYWQNEAEILEQIIAEGQKVLADQKPTFVLTFSFGGLLAKAMVARSDNHAVQAIVSLATEHRGHLPRIARMRDISLGVPLDVDVPLYTFGGWFDAVVWPWTTFTDRSTHRLLANGHFAFIRSRKTRNIVIADLQGIVARYYRR